MASSSTTHEPRDFSSPTSKHHVKRVSHLATQDGQLGPSRKVLFYHLVQDQLRVITNHVSPCLWVFQ